MNGSVVALGKFDALHVGHRALAEEASRMGKPCLVSFGGMAEELGWSPRPPLTASCDRHRVRVLWKENCRKKDVEERELPFGRIRSLSPDEFVDMLCDQYHVRGMVAGANYRFGYRAAGDAELLKRLGEKRGMEVSILELVGIEDLGAEPVVSSTRIRDALEEGDMRTAALLLGRPYRVVIDPRRIQRDATSLDDPTHTFHGEAVLNQTPGPGTYACWVTFLSKSIPLDIVACRTIHRREAEVVITDRGTVEVSSCEIELDADDPPLLVLDFESFPG